MFEVIEKNCPIRIRPKPREIELRGNFSLQFSPGASVRLPGSTDLMGFQQNLTDVPPALMLDGAQKGKKSSIQPIEKAYTVAKLKSTHKIRHWGSEQWQRLRRFVSVKIPLPSIYCRLKLSAHLRRWNILSQDTATFQTKPITTCIDTRTAIPLSCQ